MLSGMADHLAIQHPGKSGDTATLTEYYGNRFCLFYLSGIQEA